MGLKTTLFAILAVWVITWRNRKIADLEGKKPQYTLSGYKDFFRDAVKGAGKLFGRQDKA